MSLNPIILEGFKLDIGTFKNGNGLLKRFDEKEEVISEVNYENGIKEGEAFFYDSDGHLRTKVLFTWQANWNLVNLPIYA